MPPEAETAREELFRNAVRQHQAAIWRYLRFLGCEEDQADDLCQETLLVLWRFPFEERRPAQTWAYLRKSARNFFLMALRSKRVRGSFESLDEADVAWGRYDADSGDAFREALGECLGELSPRATRAIRLRYHDRHGRDEIATALEMKPDGVKTLLRRSRDLLRSCIEGRVS